jgi:hypothetical protein
MSVVPPALAGTWLLPHPACIDVTTCRSRCCVGPRAVVRPGARVSVVAKALGATVLGLRGDVVNNGEATIICIREGEGRLNITSYHAQQRSELISKRERESFLTSASLMSGRRPVRNTIQLIIPTKRKKRYRALFFRSHQRTPTQGIDSNIQCERHQRK